MIRRASAALALLAAPAAAEIAVTDALGRIVTVPAPPDRVVALYNDAFGQMASLGIRPVATLVNPEMAADEEHYFEDGASIPLVANMDGSPDPEIVASFAPDLVIGWSAEEAAAMEGIAPFYALDGVDGVEGVKDNLRDLGRSLGCLSARRRRSPPSRRAWRATRRACRTGPRWSSSAPRARTASGSAPRATRPARSSTSWRPASDPRPPAAGATGARRRRCSRSTPT